jgi:hypothetical protein
METIDTNGITGTPTVNAYVIIHRMEVKTWGATSTNIGDLNAIAAVDGTTTAHIHIAEGQTQMAQGQSGEAQQGDASMATPSSAVNRSEGTQPPGTETGPAGNATGDPTGAPLELGASTTLEAQLALEVIDGDAPESQDNRELDPKDLFQEASRQQSSIVQYRDVSAPSNYAQGSALNAEQIPWRYRSLVKRYFLAIRPAPHSAPGWYVSGQDGANERK